LTGSANPTERGFLMNDNNVVKFESEFLAKNYLGEFNTLKSGNFGYNKESSLRYNNLSLRYGKENYLVSSYFCPQDDCDLELLKLVDDARDEILFATFAITYDNLSELLVEKVDSGVEVRGLIESRNVNLKGSDYNYLNESFEFFLDSNKYNMHNKFFVIDERVVVTGSVNPSASGFNYNDENMLVIENEKIAKMYKGYFLNLI
jgi:phosphatidylserine/phosphatidylglycerophosphate/cardiolipin synthase-like enzyme